MGDAEPPLPLQPGASAELICLPCSIPAAPCFALNVPKRKSVRFSNKPCIHEIPAPNSAILRSTKSQSPLYRVNNTEKGRKLREMLVTDSILANLAAKEQADTLHSEVEADDAAAEVVR